MELVTDVLKYGFMAFVVMLIEFILINIIQGLENTGFSYSDTVLFLLYLSLPLTMMMLIYILYNKHFGEEAFN